MARVKTPECLFYFSSQPHDGEQLQIRRMGFAEPMRPGVVDRPGTNDVFMLLAPAGCEIGDRVGIRCLERPSFIYWREQQAHYYGRVESEWSHTWMHMSGAWLRRLGHLCPSNTCIALDDATAVEHTYMLIYDELQRSRPDEKILANMIEQILLRVKRCAEESDSSDEIPVTFIGIKRFIDNNYSMSLSLKELAERVALSPSHFSNRFRHYFSCSPIDYLIRVRMEQAKHMLSNRNMRISEVSQLVGYEDIGYFSRLLKRYYGLNPRDMRKQLLAE